MERRTLLLICLCLGVLVVNLFATEPALDATDQRAIDLALRAMKMTEHDLSFSKTNVESELLLGRSKMLLQNPLQLAGVGARALASFRSFRSLSNPLELVQQQLELAPTWSTNIFLSKSDLNPTLSPDLPAAVAEVVKKICIAATASKELLDESLPKQQAPAFAAWALEAFHLDSDKQELETWKKLNLDTTAIRDFLDRDERMELQDTELADPILIAADHFDQAKLILASKMLAGVVDSAIAELRSTEFHDEFQVESESPLGRIIVGGIGRNVYTNEAFLIIDLGGDDVYENSAGGANGLTGQPISIVIDLAGNDQYISRRSFSQGSGVFGIGILVDCGGDDVYEAKHLSQGAGFFGCGLLADYGGHDKFVADTFVQGAAEFGAGILWQRGGNTEYRASQLAQGYGSVQGCGLLLDEAGDDSYLAGGKSSCSWLPGHYFSLAQGFGQGLRPFAGGGVGILCDLKGDDHYVADVYGQGASYWYSVGLLLDAEGNDKYEAYQYCQGAGIHLSSGALIDWAGDDTYTAGHICQGAAHDYSVGMLIDRAGNDKYTGDTTAQGSAINNSFAMLLDHAGDDTYTGTDPKQSQATGHDGEKREYGSIALMLDLAGNDTYSQGQSNNAVWLKPLYGAGLDVGVIVGQAPRLPVPETTAGGAPAPHPTGRLYQIAPVDPHDPIERLFRRATSDRPDADAALKELKRQATNALPYLISRFDSPNVLIRVKAEELVDQLDTNSIPILIAGIDGAKNDDVARLCCYFLARFNERARAAVPHVLPLLNRDKTRPTALYTLGHLRAREVFAPALAALNERELIRLRAVQALGKIGDRRATPKLILKLDDEIYDVRYAAEDALVAMGQSSIGPLRKAYAKASRRARPHFIEALARLHDRRALTLAQAEYRDDNRIVREALIHSLKTLLDAKPEPSRPR